MEKQTENPMTLITVILNPSEKSGLRSAAEAEGLSMNMYIRKTLGFPPMRPKKKIE